MQKYDESVGFNSYTDAGRFVDAFVSDIIGAPLVTGRNVNYGYGDNTLVDGHAVETLVNKSDGSDNTAYGYDKSGNVIKRVESVGNQTWDFSYDGSDQQRRVIAPGGNEEIYYYDENNQRFLSVERNAAGDTIRTRFWFGNTELWYGDGNGIKEKAMTNLSLGATNVARIDNELGQQELEYSFHNGLGHMMAAVSEAGDLTTSYIYGPFGEIIEQSGDTDDHLRRFNGKEADQLSRLNYYGYRYYDPLSLQWTQADPLYRVLPDIAYDSPRLMSLYTFSLNNPVRYMDPDGRSPSATMGAAGVACGTGIACPAALTVAAVVVLASVFDIDLPTPSLPDISWPTLGTPNPKILQMEDDDAFPSQLPNITPMESPVLAEQVTAAPTTDATTGTPTADTAAPTPAKPTTTKPSATKPKGQKPQTKKQRQRAAREKKLQRRNTNEHRTTRNGKKSKKQKHEEAQKARNQTLKDKKRQRGNWVQR